MPGGDRSRASASVTSAGYCPLVATGFAPIVSSSQSTFGLDGAAPPGAQMRPEAQGATVKPWFQPEAGGAREAAPATCGGALRAKVSAKGVR